jgi:plasmid stabilization system protein ParE
LFADELAAAFDIIARTPNIGRSYQHPAVRGTRRILLRQTRYHVYYVASAEAVIVLAVWHARRGVGPPLRAAAPPE